MKIEQRTVYISCHDGVEFDTEQECLLHEKSEGFKDYLARLIYEGTELREDDSSQVAEFIAGLFSYLIEEYNSL